MLKPDPTAGEYLPVQNGREKIDMLLEVIEKFATFVENGIYMTKKDQKELAFQLLRKGKALNSEKFIVAD